MVRYLQYSVSPFSFAPKITSNIIQIVTDFIKIVTDFIQMITDFILLITDNILAVSEKNLRVLNRVKIKQVKTLIIRRLRVGRRDK